MLLLFFFVVFFFDVFFFFFFLCVCVFGLFFISTFKQIMFSTWLFAFSKVYFKLSNQASM